MRRAGVARPSDAEWATPRPRSRRRGRPGAARPTPRPRSPSSRAAARWGSPRGRRAPTFLPYSTVAAASSYASGPVAGSPCPPSEAGDRPDALELGVHPHPRLLPGPDPSDSSPEADEPEPSRQKLAVERSPSEPPGVGPLAGRLQERASSRWSSGGSDADRPGTWSRTALWPPPPSTPACDGPRDHRVVGRSPAELGHTSRLVVAVGTRPDERPPVGVRWQDSSACPGRRRSSPAAMSSRASGPRRWPCPTPTRRTPGPAPRWRVRSKTFAHVLVAQEGYTSAYRDVTGRDRADHGADLPLIRRRAVGAGQRRTKSRSTGRRGRRPSSAWCSTTTPTGTRSPSW